MEKQQFVDLLGRFSKSTENEALNIMALKEYFPYSQVFHALSARATKDHRFLEQKAALQLAAVYAADRAVLKQVMTDDELPGGKTLPPFLNIVPNSTPSFDRYNEDNEVFVDSSKDARAEAALNDTLQPVVETQVPDLTKARQTDAGTLNFQQRAQQLHAEALAAAEAKAASERAESAAEMVKAESPEHNLPAETKPGVAAIQVVVNESDQVTSEESSQEDAQAPATVVTPAPEMNVADQVISDLEKLNQLKHNFEALFEANKASIILRDAALAVGAAPADDLNRIQLARQKRIAELVSSLDPELNTSDDTLAALDYTVANKNFLEDIKNNKEALEPESQKQKDQIQMIDNFISTQPILNNKDKNSPAEDLTTIKTGEFNDNVVSETLVDILVKQGKKDKAIEVLKKLIWKFPQKKAYFAAQIEDLKK